MEAANESSRLLAALFVPQKKQKKEVVLVLDERVHLKEVEKALRAAGLTELKHQETIGTVTGYIDPNRIHELTAIPGVLAAEESQTFQLPPPDAPVQ